MSIGKKHWAIPKGWIPSWSYGPEPAMLSHETACILNANEVDAHVEITIFYSDRDPVGPYKITVPARRTLHQRFNDLTDPEPIPKATNYASTIDSDVTIVVQHTRLDSRQSELGGAWTASPRFGYATANLPGAWIGSI